MERNSNELLRQIHQEVLDTKKMVQNLDSDVQIIKQGVNEVSTNTNNMTNMWKKTFEDSLKIQKMTYDLLKEMQNNSSDNMRHVVPQQAHPQAINPAQNAVDGPNNNNVAQQPQAQAQVPQANQTPQQLQPAEVLAPQRALAQNAAVVDALPAQAPLLPAEERRTWTIIAQYSGGIFKKTKAVKVLLEEGNRKVRIGDARVDAYGVTPADKRQKASFRAHSLKYSVRGAECEDLQAWYTSLNN